jgi:hypothetical protein
MRTFPRLSPAAWMVWESAPDAGSESNAIARHHTQLKMAIAVNFTARIWKMPGVQWLWAGFMFNNMKTQYMSAQALTRPGSASLNRARFAVSALSALAAGNSAGFGIDQMNACASHAGHRMIGGAVIVRRGIDGMRLHIVAGDGAAIDESSHRSLLRHDPESGNRFSEKIMPHQIFLASAIWRASPENYVKAGFAIPM